MIRLVRTHFNFLYTKKIQYTTGAILLILSFIFIWFSKGYHTVSDLEFNVSQYKEGYYLESIGLFKIIIVMYNVFGVFYCYIINDYNVILCNRFTPLKVLISQFVVCCIQNGLFAITGGLLFFVIGFFTRVYVFSGREIIILELQLMLLSMFYSVLSIVVVSVGKNVYGLFAVFTLYIVSMFAVDHYVDISEISSFGKIMNLLFFDLIYVGNYSFQFVYGGVYITCLIVVICTGYFRYILKNDFM